MTRFGTHRRAGVPFGARRGGTPSRSWLLACLHAALVIILCSACSDETCPAECDPCGGPHFAVWNMEIQPAETEPLDTTYLSARCGPFSCPPTDFGWFVSVGDMGPLVRQERECTALAAAGNCESWVIEEMVIWYPPHVAVLCRGELRLLIPCWGEFVMSIYARYGHAVAPLLILSQPPGAEILLDDQSTGLTTPDTLCVRDWWRDHTVTLRLSGYQSESWSTENLLSPLVIDSVVSRLEPDYDGETR
jgi:hypothetical protein